MGDIPRAAEVQVDMELRRLKYFVAVAEELNFRRAAEQLHVAQPAVSQQVRKLECELGIDLFRRTKRSVALWRVIAAPGSAWSSRFGHNTSSRHDPSAPGDVAMTTAEKFSFATAHNRLLSGGWAREVTTRELPIATELAGVNMRLKPGDPRDALAQGMRLYAAVLPLAVTLLVIARATRGGVADRPD